MRIGEGENERYKNCFFFFFLNFGRYGQEGNFSKNAGNVKKASGKGSTSLPCHGKIPDGPAAFPGHRI